MLVLIELVLNVFVLVLVLCWCSICACVNCHSITYQIVLVRKHRGVVHDSSQQVYLGEQERSYWGSRRGIIG